MKVASPGVVPDRALFTSRSYGPAVDQLPADVIATVYACLGISHETELKDRLQRPYPLVPWGNPITEIIG